MGVIEPKAIPDLVALLQAGFIESAVLDYFKDPVHEKEFRKWKRERRKREYETILRYFEDPEHQAEFEKWLQEGGEKSEGLQVIDGGGGCDHSSGSSSSGGK